MIEGLDRLDFPALQEGTQAIEGVLVPKTIDENGGQEYSIRYTTGIQTPECLGMAEMAVVLLKEEVKKYFEPLDDND